MDLSGNWRSANGSTFTLDSAGRIVRMRFDWFEEPEGCVDCSPMESAVRCRDGAVYVPIACSASGCSGEQWGLLIERESGGKP